MSLVQPPLADRHATAATKVGAFAGWEMPIVFEGTIAEHTAVREAVGVFDVSHLGTLFLTGAGATAAIDGSFTNNASSLTDGGSQYTLCATEDGGVIDDLIIYRHTADRWMVIPNASNTAAVLARLQQVAGDDVQIEDASQTWAVLAVQGPKAFALVEATLGVDPSTLLFAQHTVTHIDGSPVVVCRTGYTGEQGVELVCPAAVAGGVWDALVAGGAVRCGLAARDTLRLEMGYPLHGNELSVDISPYEARSGWAVKLPDRSFVGRDALVAAKAAGPSRRLWGLVGDSRRPPRAGMDVSVNGTVVGVVTSGSFSPTRGVGIGLGLLASSVEAGEIATVDVRGTDVAFTVTSPPMVNSNPR
ncbi:MAG: aminomethyltransferase [Nitriliruptoraceae bacterium]